jgi:CIC family chloride channel protein
VFSVAFRNPAHGVLGGGDLAATEVIDNFARSKDGGKTWELATNAPIAGALFVAEIALGTHALARLAPILLASMVGNAIAREVFGPAPLFSAGSLQAGGLMEMPAWLALGALAGAVAPLFLWLITAARKIFSRLTVPLAAKMALGGLVVGTISIAEPRVWGNGYSVIDALLHAEWAWIAVTQVLLLKALATAATSGSGTVGGIFTPTLLIGASLGNLFGTVLTASIPGVAGTPAAYAAIGMGALLAATTHAPLTAILMIIETTGGDALTLPLTAACVVAYLVARAVGSESVYADSLRTVPADGAGVAAERDSG